MGILDSLRSLIGRPSPLAEQHVLSEPTRIKVTLDLSTIHDKRHVGPGFYGYSWEENAAIGVMNNLVAAGIPMDWAHFIEWRLEEKSRDALSFERMRPLRGVLSAERDFIHREKVRVTWTAD